MSDIAFTVLGITATGLPDPGPFGAAHLVGSGASGRRSVQR